MDTSDADSETAVPYRALFTDAQVIVISLTSFIGITGSRIPSPVLPSIANTFAVSDSQVGLIMTAFFLPSIVMVPSVGLLADMYGRRRLVLTAYLVFGVSGTAIAFATTFEQILALRVLQGVGFAGLTPLTIVLVGDLYDGAKASAVQGIRVSGNSLAGIIIPALAGFLAGIAWNYPFLIFGLTFPLFVAAYVFLPETKRDTDGGTEGLGAYLRALRSELTDRNLRILMVGGFTVFFFKYAILTYAPLYAVRELGVSVFLAGLLISLRGVARTIVAPLAGKLSSDISRRGTLLGAITVGAGGTLAFPFAPDFAWLMGAMFVYSVGDGLFSPILNDGVAALASDQRRSGVVSALNVLKMAANTSSPAFFGLVLAVSDFSVMFVLAGLLGLAYVPLAYVTLRFE
jgi:predicted MFS family arabinose efflux permease